MATVRSFRPFILARLRDLWASAFAGYATAFVAGVIIAAIGLAIAGCRSPASAAAKAAKGAAGKMAEGGGPAGADHFWYLHWIAGACVLIGVAALITSFVLPAFLVWTKRLAAGCFGSAAGCWATWGLLKLFFWPAIIAGGAVAVITGLLYVWGHRRWIEKRLGVDLDRDGHIGDPPKAKG